MKQPHGHKLRAGRYSEQGRIYLVTTVTHQRQPCFHDWQCGRLLARALGDDRDADTLAYVVMPDHLHWLMQVNSQASLQSIVHRVKSVSSRRTNRYLGCCGRLWQPGFHDHALRREEDVRVVARYVVANPLRAGLVRRLGDYPLWDAAWI